MDCKILIINSEYPNKIGGVEKVIKQLHDFLEKEKGIEVRILHSNNYHDYKGNIFVKMLLILYEEISFLLLPIDKTMKQYKVWFGVGSLLKSFLNFFRFWVSYFSTVKIIKNYKPDVINYHFVDDSVYVMSKVSGLKLSKLIVNVHGNDLEKFAKNKKHKKNMQKTLVNCDLIICNSRDMYAKIVKNFSSLNHNKIKIIPNGIDSNEIKSIMPLKYFKENEQYAFFVGRAVHKKGIDILIKAVEKINVKLLIEGNGEELKNLKSLVNKLNLNNKIVFTEGRLNQVEKVAYMKGADVIVVPSRSEPFGLIALEALASGVPLVASNVGGMKDFLIHNKNSLLFESENYTELAEKINSAIHNKQLASKLTKNGYQTVEEYSLDAVHKKYLNLYFEK